MQTTVEEDNNFLMPNGSWADGVNDLQNAVEECLRGMNQRNILNRIWQHDHTIWKEDPTEIANRLGWLHSPETMKQAIPDLNAFANEVRNAGFTRAILCGMGGSSLAPEVYRHIFGVRDGYLDLSVLDSTDPGAVLDINRSIDLAKTLFIISTKSGRTVETASFMKFFFNEVIKVVGSENASEHFVAITDPGSELENTAKRLKFRRFYLNDPNIGGRYSALSYFGLVPAALIGMDLNRLLNQAHEMARISGKGNSSPKWLGTAIGEATMAGRDKLTLITSPSLRYFGGWAEQLIAESTGKEGKGILPVDGETIVDPALYADDRFFVYIRLDGEDALDEKVRILAEAGHPVTQLNLGDLYDIGGEFFRWEIATVVASHRMGINPFNQPNVESAKNEARAMVDSYQANGTLPELTPTLCSGNIKVYAEFKANSLDEALKRFLVLAKSEKDDARGRPYAAIQAYLKPTQATDEALQRLRTTIQTQYRLAVTTGYGPRFLHSTGQLHKGDAGHGLFIQLTADTPEDLPIPDEAGRDGSSMTFGVLKNAQALGDRQALLDNGRHVIRFHLGDDAPAELDTLNDILR